jgi:DNA excision repair protein ERCC-3
MDSTTQDNPLIVLNDRTVLLDTHSPLSDAARDKLARFAEMVKCPDHVHTYRLTDLSIWNACALGMLETEMQAVLIDYSKFPPPETILAKLMDLAGRYGRVVLERDGDDLRLSVSDEETATALKNDENVGTMIGVKTGPLSFRVDVAERGRLKQALVHAGYPAQDRAGYLDGEFLNIRFRQTTRSGNTFRLRDYQREAVDVFCRNGSNLGGSGVICLPCGAGKTMVGLGAIGQLQQTALILTTSMTSVKQWRRELLDKTDIDEEMIAEYTGETKQIGQITLSTYQLMTWRPDKAADFPHFKLFHARPWGLIIYDEVHLLPAPVFRITADLQARRRLGMTATLVREDGREADVFALIGPKRVDTPWRNLETDGWIARAVCAEVRIPMSEKNRLAYAVADKRGQFRMAAENPVKIAMIRRILADHPDAKVLIIGEYLRQLHNIADLLGVDLVTGKTPPAQRETLYDRFRRGGICRLILSRVGNFALDLPDADVLIQVSGMFGSRQEEAQRLGRILRPKPDGRQACFYTVVSRQTREEDFARNRQRFLVEQGYSYEIRHEEMNT